MIKSYIINKLKWKKNTKEISDFLDTVDFTKSDKEILAYIKQYVNPKNE